MDFNEILDKVKISFLNIFDKIVDFYNENKKLAIIIASSVLIILICILLLCFNIGKTKQKSTVIPEKLILSEALVIPDGPTLPRDYNISRKHKDKWSSEEANEWFTVPSDNEIEALSKSNNAIVNEIIGAAP